MRPIKKVYLNFDKDLAHRMFGYRVRFKDEDMSENNKVGAPENDAPQAHKPIHHYQRECMAAVVGRYS